jgi:general secretion pathway protein G
MKMKPYRSKKRSRRQAGFTLVEMILVLGIIAVLLGTAIFKMVGAVGGAKVQRVDGDISSITSALRMYEINNRYLPTTQQGLMALVKKPESEPVPRRWTQQFKEIPTDPWNKPYVYVYPGKHNPTGFDLYSLGEDGVEGGEDYGNW